MNSAREIWYSLYTSELEDIWRSTEGALRKPQMICFVLTKELQKLQGNVTNENQIFIERQKSDERPASVANVPLLESNFNNNSSPIKQMPTLIPLKKEKMDVDDIIDRPTEENLFLTPSVASVNVPMVNSPAITKNSQIMSVIENTKTMVVRQKKEDKSPKFTHLLKIIPPYKSVGHETSLFNKLAPNGTQFGVETKDASAAETVADIRTKTNTTSKNNNQNIYAIKDYNESVRHETSLLNKLAPNGKQFSVETKDANVWETVADIRTKTNTTSQNDNQNIYLFKDYNESVRHETSLLNKLAPNGKQFSVETKDANVWETVADIRTKTNTTSQNDNQNIYLFKDYNESVRHETSLLNKLAPNGKQFGVETKDASAMETVADIRTKTNTTSKNNNQNIYAIKDYNESVRHETSLLNKLAPNGKQFGVETKDANVWETVADIRTKTNTTSQNDNQNVYLFKDYNESVRHETSLLNKLAPNGKQFGVETKDASATETVADIRTKTNTTSKNNNQNIYAIKDYNESVRHETSLLNKLAPNGKQFSVETKDANVWETVADIRTKTNTTSQNDNQNIYLFKDYNESVRHETSLLNKLAPNGKQFGVETKDASAMETVADIRTKTNTTSKNNNQNIYAIKDYNESVRHETSLLNKLAPNGKQFGVETKDANVWETVADIRTKTNTTSQNDNQNVYLFKDYNESVRHETSLLNKLAPNGKQFGVETKDASATETVADIRTKTNTTSKNNNQNIYAIKDYNEFVRHEISFFNNLEPNAKQFGIETKHASAEETVADVRTKTNTTSKNNNQNIYAIKDYNESVRHETSLFNKLAPNGKQFGVETKDASAEETVADVKMETNTTSKIDIQNIYVFKDYNEFSIVEPKSPICVQKTKPVRSRDDNMQLPGWSYKGYKKNNEKFNSLPQQLRQKMYACSQLQKKFKSLNATSKGYGDGDV